MPTMTEQVTLVPRQTVTLEESSERMGISHRVIRRLIESKDTGYPSRAVGALGDSDRGDRVRGCWCRKSPARSAVHGT
jgi:hypothetical protein